MRRKQTAADRAKNYQRRRTALIVALGNKCVDCGTTENLELDARVKHERKPNELSRWQRVAMYERDHAAGKLECRCRSCNAKAGEPAPAHRTAPLESAPF